MSCRILVSALVAGVLALSSAGCQEPADAGRNSDRAVGAGDQYVALGDSYTSAPGVGDLSGTPGCQQTDANYPHVLAARLDLELTDVSCGGATTANLTDPQLLPGGGTAEPQLDALSDETDLVTFRIGANNHSLYETWLSICIPLGKKDPDGAPCAEAEAKERGLEKRIRDLRKRLGGVIADIADRAPNARIIAVGYPQFVPKEAEDCTQLPLATGDYALGHRLNKQVNDALADAAEKAGIEYVDAFAATRDHDMCAEDPWIAGADPIRPAYPYHPYAEEQEKVADLLVALLKK